MKILKNIRFYIVLFICRIVYLGMRLLGRKATHLPGVIANKLCPNFLSYIKKPQITIAVTGTNGKTTTCNILNDFFTLQGKKVINNKAGSNLRAGISTSFIASFKKKDVAIIEVDERASYQTLPYLKPNYLICTNLFRDSIKRNANPEYIFDILDNNIPRETTLILNADDLISNRLGKNNKKIYYGIAKLPTDHDDVYNIVHDAVYCPNCYSKLKFNYVKYHHIGNAYCPKCDFKSPKCDYLIEKINYKNQSILINNKIYHMLSTSLFNTYNELAVISLLLELKYPSKEINNTLENIRLTELRLKEKKVGSIDITSIVVKGQNPVACSQNFNYVKNTPGKKEIIIMLDDIHDNAKSSENINWIYDSDFEFLNDQNIEKVIIGGPRAYDFYLRLLLANIPKEKLFYTLTEKETSNYLSYSKNIDKIFILHDLYNGEYADEIFKTIIEKYEGLK